MTNNKVGTPVTLRPSLYSNPGSGVREVGEDTGKKPEAIRKYRDDKDTDRGHKVVGNAASVPSTEAPKTHPAARHDEGTDAQPSAGTRQKAGATILRDGTHQESRGYEYVPEAKEPVAHEDEGAAARAIRPQIMSSTPTAEMVKESQKNKIT
jgi:hypothetical protein